MGRTEITTDYTSRQWITFITTELLDFLMTEDDKHLITDESIFSEYATRTWVTTNYT